MKLSASKLKKGMVKTKPASKRRPLRGRCPNAMTSTSVTCLWLDLSHLYFWRIKFCVLTCSHDFSIPVIPRRIKVMIDTFNLRGLCGGSNFHDGVFIEILLKRSSGPEKIFLYRTHDMLLRILWEKGCSIPRVQKENLSCGVYGHWRKRKAEQTFNTG